jgi:caffeoyl-CoA O-methyltransferase
VPDKFTALTPELHGYLVEHGAREDEVLRRVREETEERLPDRAMMQIAPDQGALMSLLVRAIGAQEALELGTFTGYSAICIARGLAPGGRLITCEIDEGFAETAAQYLQAAGVAERVEIRIGPALETLRAIPQREVFDFAFIDADKPSYPDYYEETLARMRPGGLVMVDNVLAGGSVVDRESEGFAPESIAALRELNDRMAGDERVDLVMLGIADGVALARKR